MDLHFIYHKDCGNSIITLDKSTLHHIVDVRREKCNIGDILRFANLKDSKIYQYKLIDKTKKEITLHHLDSTIITQKSYNTHIIQAIIDMNEFSKILPSLNELFVDKITFFYSDFSQKNQKVNIERLTKILINSCTQCGRINLMDFEILQNLDMVLDLYGDAIALDFDGKSHNIKSFNSFIVGPEGGFSKREKMLLAHKSLGINHPLILRSITASIYIAANKI